jgi:TonB-linked SusC/RagA family outer membrane protein
MRLRILSALAMLVLAAAPNSALAQGEALLTGKVTSTAGAPVAGAQVFLDNMGLGTLTKDDGTYRFTVPAARVTGQSATLTVHILGFKPKTVPVTLSAGTITTNFALEAQAAVLQAIVITGEGTITTNEKLGATINNVGSEEITKSNEQNLTAGLAGKAPNVQITSQSGDPGGSVNIQIRGIKTFTGDGQPLFIVDGVPVDNSSLNTQAGIPGVNNQEQGTVAPNRIADLNPNDVESVTILKGSAAAAIYGARAAQGVVIITTKSGKAGPTKYSLHSSFSFDKVTSGYGLQNRYGQGDLGASGIDSSLDAYSQSHTWGELLPAGTKTYDHFSEMFGTGHVADNNLSISGGDDRRSFFLSAGINNNDGFVVGPNDSYKRSSFRLKATQLIGEKLKLGGNVSYIDTRGSYIQRGDNTSGIMLGGMRTPPEFNNKAVFAENGQYRSYRFQNPSDTTTAYSRGYDNPFWITSEAPARSQLSRVLGNVDLNWEPLDWLKVQETAGADYYTDARLEGLPLGNSTTHDGEVIRADYKNYILDHNLVVIGSHTFSPSFLGTLTLGQNLNSTDFNQVYALGSGLIAPKPFVIQNVADVTVNDQEVLVHRESYFGQATADLWDQLFLTGAIRNDGFSTFGQNNRRHWFPKASAAWTFTKAISGLTSKIDFAKIRAAYGETGREPAAYSTLTSFPVGQFTEYGGDASGVLRTIYMGGRGLIGPDSVGSDSLRPERTREYEGGLDFGLFKGWMDMGISYYDSKTNDVIFEAPTPPSSGSQKIIRNAATITNKGWEVTANLHPIRQSDLTWDIGLVWGRNRNLVTDLSGSTDILVGSQAILTTVARVGFPTGSFAGYDFYRCGRGLSVNGVAIDEASAGAGGCLDAGGKAPAKGTIFLAANGFPVLDQDNLLVLGSAQPDWNGSIRTNIGFRKHWDVSALLDIKHGGQAYNGTRGALYVYGTHKDTDIRNQIFVFGPSTNGVQGFHGDPTVAGPGVGVPVVIDQNWFENDGGAFGFNTKDFIEDAGFAKLREVSVGYTFDQPWVSSSLGLSSIQLRMAGRNLKTWTHYTGLDPETQLGGATLVGGFDWFNNPQTRSFVVTVGLNR